MKSVGGVFLALFAWWKYWL